MNNIKIIVDYEIYHYENSDSIATKIFVQSGGISFPDENWTDITSYVLGMWVYKLLENKYHENSFKLYFTDGPFFLRVEKDSNMQLQIRCVNARGFQEIEEYSFSCSYHEFMKEMYEAFKRFNFLLFSENLHEGKFAPIYRQNIENMKEIKQLFK